MAVFEVFIPALESSMPNVTLTIEGRNWIEALRSGLKSIGEGGDAIANVMCDIKEDGSIHVTDVTTRRVFRLREQKKQEEPKTIPDPGTASTTQAPRPISIPEGPGLPASGSDFSSAPKTLLQFAAMPKEITQPPAPAAPPPSPPAAKPAPAVVASPPAAKLPDLEQSVPWTKMPNPGVPSPQAQMAPMPVTAVSAPTVSTSAPAAPAPAPAAKAPAAAVVAAPPQPAQPAPTPAPTPLARTPTPSPFLRATPARGIVAPKPTSGSVPVVSPQVMDRDTAKIPVARFSEETERVEKASPKGSPPTPRGVPAPVPKRASGQFSEAPRPQAREESRPNKTDPKIGRSGEVSVDVTDAIAAVFDATQDLYLEARLTPQKVADTLLDIALAHISAESGTFYLADVNGHELTFAAVRGPKADTLKRSGMTVPLGQGIIGFCALEGVCLSVSDIQKDPRWLSSIGKKLDYVPRDTLCASAEKDGRLFGALQLINSKKGFTAAHMEVLRFIGLTAAALLERVEAAA